MVTINPGDVVRRTTPPSSSYTVADKPFVVATLHSTGGLRRPWAVDVHGQRHNPANLELLLHYDENTSDEEALAIVNTSLAKAERLVTTMPVVPAPIIVHDPINPSHYQQGGLEAIDVLEAFDLVRDGRLFNVGKYILRLGKKDAELQDAKKARWYLDRYIAHLERKASA